MTTATCAVGDRVVEPEPVRSTRKRLTESGIFEALGRAPMTTSELRDAVGAVPYQFVHWYGAQGCRGHLQDVTWYRPHASDLQRRLVAFERKGVVQRFVADWQSHLWALA